MRVGVLGTGFGKYHAQIFRALPGVEVVGIVGRNAQKTAAAAEALGISGYTDPAVLLDDPTIDLIDVCYPTALHAHYAIAALAQGKHVFCETPVALTLDEAEQMAQAARTNNKLLLVGLYDRFVSDYTYVCNYIKRGQLGAPRFVFANRRTPPIWGNLAENMILSLMIHDIDYLEWLLGAPRAVTTRGVQHPMAGWDQVLITLEFEDRAALIEGCGIMPKSFPFSTSLRVVCEHGAIDLDWAFQGDRPVSEVILYPQDGAPEKLSNPDYDPYQAECQYVIDCLEGKADPDLLSIETACRSLRIAIAAQQSLEQQGTRITL